MEPRTHASRRRYREKDGRVKKRRRDKQEQSSERRRRKRAPILLNLRLKRPKPVPLRLSRDVSTVKERLRENELNTLMEYSESLNAPWLNANTVMHLAILEGKTPEEAWAIARISNKRFYDMFMGDDRVPKISDVQSLCELLLKHVEKVKTEFEESKTGELEKLYETKLPRNCLRLLIRLPKSRKSTNETIRLLRCLRLFLTLEIGSPKRFPRKCTTNLVVNEIAKSGIMRYVYKTLVEAYDSIPEDRIEEFRTHMLFILATPFMFFTAEGIFPYIRDDVLKDLKASAVTVLQYSKSNLFNAFVVDLARFMAKEKKSWFTKYVPTVLNTILRHRTKLEGVSHQAIMHLVLRQLSDASADVQKYVTSVELFSPLSHKLDVLFAALCSENVQQDLLCSQKRDTFLRFVETLYSSVTTMFHGRPVLAAERQAEKTFGWAAQELDYDPYVVSADRERIVARVIGFYIELTGYLDFNVFHAITSYEKSKSDISRVFKWLFRLQRCARRTIQLENGKKVEIVTPDDANAFSIQLERVRNEVLRLKTDVKPPKKPEPVTNLPRIVFPPITAVKDFAKVISTKSKVHFENDPNVLSFICKQYKDNAHELLSRFDPKLEHPPRWSLINRNLYVAPAKPEKVEKVGMCPCISRSGRNKCEDDSCVNVAMKMECSIKCGVNCANRRLQSGVTAKTRVVNAGEKGLGLQPVKDLKPGDFVGEYCGEVIDKSEFHRRVKLYQEEIHFYFMQLSPNLTIDASRRSGITRYINHSCTPNCDTQKWIAGGQERIALIANRHIRSDEELTFDYSAMALSVTDKQCQCGSAKCREKLTTQDKRLAESVDDAAATGTQDRRRKKVAIAHNQLRTANKLMREAKVAHMKRKDMVINTKVVEGWKEQQKVVRKSFRIPRKTSKFQPAAPRGQVKEEIVASGTTRPSFGWQNRKRQWGFDKVNEAQPQKAQKVQKGDNPPRKNVFQPHERADDIRRRQREQGWNGNKYSRRGYQKKHKTDIERRVEEYDSANSDYSVISDGKPEPEDAWQYDVPELYSHNPYAFNDGRYGEAICRIDAGKFSNVYAERKYDEHNRRR